MLKLGRCTKVKVLFLVLVFVFNFDLFKFSAAILEKGLLLQYLTFCEFRAQQKAFFSSCTACNTVNRT